MDRKILPVTALVATALLFGQRPIVGSYASDTVAAAPGATRLSQQHARSASQVSAHTAESIQDCGIGAHCDALVPYRETGPWTASCSWFGADGQRAASRGESVHLEDHPPGQQEVHKEDWCLGNPDAVRLEFLLVTLPDPVTTHLALYFDRTIEAIEVAAHQYDLYLSRYWLPWPLSAGSAAAADTSEDLRVNEILADFRSGQPGVLIFTGLQPENGPGATSRATVKSAAGESRREAERATFVFLIGESPTGGINKSQFKNAVRYAKALCDQVGAVSCPNTPEHVVGPFFSGSVPSAIDLKAHLDGEKQKFDFVSGSMSSSAEEDILQRNHVNFDDTLRGDECAEEFLFEFLQTQKLTSDGSNIAILQEEETRFGGAIQGEQTRSRCTGTASPDFGLREVRHIEFPRELSRLRNASPESFGQPVAAQAEAPLPPQQGLSWNWRDVGKGEDRVPSFSGGQEPLSLQAVLVSIAEVIKREKIEYVGITGTDIFDILFLSRFLKLSVPNTRLFVLESDLLMVNSGDASRELDGTLAVTTYPLMPRSDEWVRRFSAGAASSGPPKHLFPSRIAQGIYNAVCVQLHLMRGGAGERESLCSPVATASSRITDQQPLWLTMVGRTGFWPVSLYQKQHPQDAPPAGRWAAAACDARNVWPKSDPPDVMTLLLGNSLLLWGIIHLVGMRFGSGTGYPWLAQFRVRGRQETHRHAQYQTYYLMCATLALSGMLLLLVTSCARVWWDGGMSVSGPWLSLAAELGKALVALTLLGAAAWLTVRWMSIPDSAKLIRPPVLWYLPWIAYILTVALWIHFSIRSDPAGTFFSQRAVYLTDGVSPLLPVELLLLIFYAWAWSFIRNVRLSESKQVRVPELDKLGPAGEGFSGCCAELVEATDSLVFNLRTALWMVLGFVAVISLLIRPWEALQSVEGRAYDQYFVIVFLYVCLLIGLVWGRYMYIWTRMRRILRGLERTPLRRAFSRLPQSFYSWSPLWYEDAERRAYAISARSLECFRSIVDRGGYGPDAAARLREMSDAFKRVVKLDHVESGPHKSVPMSDDRSEAVAALQGILLNTAETLLERGLVARWNKEGGSDTLDEEGVRGEKRAEKGDEKQEGKREENRSASQGKLTEETKLPFLEQEFVALRYVGLIHYESAQLKNIVVLLVVGFVLALASIGSYPFLAGRLLVWTMAAVFVFFGAGILASFAQMARDAVLSRLSGTDAGKLDLGFYLRVLSYGALPVLALLASQFPSLGRSLVSWVQPALNALH